MNPALTFLDVHTNANYLDETVAPMSVVAQLLIGSLVISTLRLVGGWCSAFEVISKVVLDSEAKVESLCFGLRLPSAQIQGVS
jgi:hypothetical protein